VEEEGVVLRLTVVAGVLVVLKQELQLDYQQELLIQSQSGQAVLDTKRRRRHKMGQTQFFSL
jgi:hypothetical protein